MFSVARLFCSLVLRRHPSSELLQAFADGELSGSLDRFMRSHIRRCGSCRTDVEDTARIFAQLNLEDPQPSEVLHLRESILMAMASISWNRQVAAEDVRRVLGTHASACLKNGDPTPELRNELAAFLGRRAADTLLERMAA